MITQIFYETCGQHSNVWSTTYADGKYSGDTRNHLLSRDMWVVKL